MLSKHLMLPKFYAPSKVLTLGAEKFSGEGPRSVKTRAKNGVKSRSGYSDSQVIG
jgi:hypothetical protein